VPSLRWQAVRIAIEDFARLHRLRELAGNAREAGLESDAVEGEDLIEEVVKRVRRGAWDPELVARSRKKLIEKTVMLESLL
jgi:hypothetical protein